MSSIITINSGVGGSDAESLKRRITEELFLTNIIAEKIIKELDTFKKLTHPDSGDLSKAVAAAEETTKAVHRIISGGNNTTGNTT